MGYITTSSSSNTIGSGSKTFTIASGLDFAVGNLIRITKSGDITTYMEGIVTSYLSTTLIVQCNNFSGIGTINSWDINLGTDRKASLKSLGVGLNPSVVVTTSWIDLDITYFVFITPNDGITRLYNVFSQVICTNTQHSANIVCRLHNHTDNLPATRIETYGVTSMENSTFTTILIDRISLGPNKDIRLQIKKISGTGIGFEVNAISAMMILEEIS